jgi:outer membrane receptor for ferrienterochelin and colicins
MHTHYLACSIFVPFALSATAVLAQQAAAPAATTSDMGRIEITSGRDNETQQRRESTASKIVIGREEIERQGDSNLGDILKRMPGITLGGAPGRGGGIRMRGLSQGYTQILLDGQRVPPGFNVESLTPEMIERVEIYRAPTAETGAQAIAGTINIITREGRKGMPTELKVGSSFQGGYASPSASLVKYHDAEKWSGNYTLSFNRYAAPDQSENDLERMDGSGTTTRRRISVSHYDRDGMHATARLQLKGDPGETFTLMPFIALSQGSTPGVIQSNQTSNFVSSSDGSSVASTENKNHFSVARLNGQWKRKLSSDSNMEWKFNVGGWNSHNEYLQTATNSQLQLLPYIQENSHVQDRSVNVGGKYTNVMGGGHQWVSGAEVESVRRTQSVVGQYQIRSGDADYRASSLRYAMYSQDEWQLTPHWSTHLGARYEGLTTQGNTSDGDVTNRNSIFTPLMHAMWRPNPDSRDQVRMSLTKSFKTPTMPTLLARRAYVRDGLNSETNPDVSGNPNLKPEIATGLDVAIERYLPQGGVLSASVFHRRVQNLIRNKLIHKSEDIQGRFLSRPENISEAVTEGIELEAKFRMDQWIADAPHIDLRNNLSFYRSRVLSIMGPDNRLDQQPSMTANFGADYKLKSAPLTVGGNINYNPGYSTRLSAEQLTTISQKRVMDVYGLWRVDGSTAWRLTLSNLDPRNYNTGSSYDNVGTPSVPRVVENSRTQNRSWTNVQILLEKKL